jgi:sec-independent protein translocase protein TatA
MALFQNIGPLEIVLIVFVVLLLFGARRIGDLGRGLGEGIKNFRSAMKDGSGDSDAASRRNDDDASSGGAKS